MVLARRKKKSKDVSLEEIGISTEVATEDLLSQITEKMNEYLSDKYGEYEDPELLIVPTDVRPLDAVLGGGLVLGMPVMVTGAAEIGKTTFAWQMIKSLQQHYPNSISLYIDVEGSANSENKDLGIKSRIELMNIDRKRLIYKSMTLSIEKVFELIVDTVKFKRQIEEKLNINIPMIVVWDSIADTDPEKLIEEADNPNSVIGLKARIVQFLLGKYKPLFRRNQVMLFLIDQVRANISDNMNNPYAGKQEKLVGQVNNLKSATGAKSVEHKLRQWLFLSQGQEIFDYTDVLGWFLDIHILKSKLAPSGFTIRTVFDKRFGIDKFWTEYHFISNLTPFEEKIFKKMGGQNSSAAKAFRNKVESILSIKSSGAYKYLEYIDPSTGEVIQSKKFYQKDAKSLYNSDKEFKDLFDKCVEFHIKERIIKYFNPDNKDIQSLLSEPDDIDEGLTEQF